MAHPLDYAPAPQAPPADFSAEADLARLVETLHESGTLRVLNGLFGRLEAVSAIALGGLDTPEGHRGLANVLVLGKLLGGLDTGALDRFVTALDRGLVAAADRLGAPDPPGTVATLARLRDRDVRRGLDAILTLLGTLGAELHAPTPATSTDRTPAPTP